MSLLPDKNYQHILDSLKEKIRLSRFTAAIAVNYELLKMYWEIGNTILEQQKEEGWGAKIIDRLAADLKTEFPDFKGLSVRNLKYMRAFAEAYPDFLIVQTPSAQLTSSQITTPAIVQHPAAQITWSHNQLILDKAKAKDERIFYAVRTFKNGWSRDVLALQIESKLWTREGKAITNFQQTLPAPDSDLAMQTFKSPYILDFLTLGEAAKEREVERGLIEHLKKFMLELGRGFAYVGNQYNLNVKGDDYFLDLLFYNYHLHCFVVFELKIGEFKPEFAGKLNFYINTINQQIKGKEDKPTIGILLCKT
ncbi:MAG: PDDEXK nuclease domain-containing protein, partial [Bacteroidota bacterium]|nr:PDDEXK nuclease domain-containing protein [Bacteroidota bacterium]